MNGLSTKRVIPQKPSKQVCHFRPAFCLNRTTRPRRLQPCRLRGYCTSKQWQPYIRLQKTLVGADAPNPKNSKSSRPRGLELFSAAHPRGRLSFAAILMGRGWFFFAEEHLDVVAMDEQLAVLVADCTVLGVGRALLRNELIELGVEVFDLWQLLNAVCVEVALRRAVLLNLALVSVVRTCASNATPYTRRRFFAFWRRSQSARAARRSP